MPTPSEPVHTAPTAGPLARPPRTLWRILVAVVGVTVTAAGAALLVLPGPGILVLFVGLSILATEFAWARGTQQRLRSAARNAGTRLRTRRARRG